MLPMFGGLILIAFIMIALAVELALLGTSYRAVASAADAGAEAGAAMLDVESLYESAVELDRAAAASQSMLVAAAQIAHVVDVQVATTSTEVCVTVRDEYRPTTLAFIGVGSIDVTVTSCAVPRTG